MAEIRARYSRSWFDGRYGPILAHEVAERLVERCQGEKVLKLELTYNRTAYGDPEELFDQASEERHVRRFIEALGKWLGYSLRGRWLCKMEFQGGGWVHWHLILIGVDYIEHGELTRLWGHGYVWVRRAEEADLRYLCKYFAKDGSIPAFLYKRPIRSVKFIRASPGFWGANGPGLGGTATFEESEGWDWVDEEKPPRLPIYKSVGQMIEEGENVTVCRDARGYYKQLACPIWMLLRRLAARFKLREGEARGWLEVAGAKLADIVAIVNEFAGLPQGPRSGPRQPAALHLIHSGNPPQLPKWLSWVFDWEFGWRDSGP